MRKAAREVAFMLIYESLFNKERDVELSCDFFSKEFETEKDVFVKEFSEYNNVQFWENIYVQFFHFRYINQSNLNYIYLLIKNGRNTN